MPKIEIRVTDEQKDELERAAENAGMNVSAYVRQRVLRGADPEVAVRTPEGRSPKELTEAEKTRQRKLRERRLAIAAEHGVAVGWVDEHGKIDPAAKKMPEEVLKARKAETDRPAA